MSMSTPALIAFMAASFVSAANPCETISPAEFQSVTTIPSNPHSLRSTSSSRKRLPVEGMPSLSLNEVIRVMAPLRTACSKGGR